MTFQRNFLTDGMKSDSYPDHFSYNYITPIIIFHANFDEISRTAI